MIIPDYIFESSWEVCNKVGGIYTVLSTKARTMTNKWQDKLLFIGPDRGNQPDDFEEDAYLFEEWKHVLPDGLDIRTGRWRVPGKPLVILISYQKLFDRRNALYYDMWETFGVDSFFANGDYDESCMFACAVGMIIESFYKYYQLENKNVAALFNEWMLGMGALYLRKHLPAIATLFTTHATTIGRSIAGNNKPLYRILPECDGTQMASELNVAAKHSLERQTAQHVDCFTTVSEITAVECNRLLDKSPDIVTPNGFEKGFVPQDAQYTKKRTAARKQLMQTVEKLTGRAVSPDAFFIATSGRYEYRNKGLDVFIDAMNLLRQSDRFERDTVALIITPAWVYEARDDLRYVLENGCKTTAPMQMPFLTHWLNNMGDDRVINYIIQSGFTNTASERLRIVFVPCYIDGRDGIFNKTYYDLLVGMDATVFASYYEPWGYTPLESIAFGIPTVTTNLAGFGMWAESIVSGNDIREGVAVVKRTDENYFEVAQNIADTLLDLINRPDEAATIRQNCFNLADKAQWEKFIANYYAAFDIAFRNKINI